MNLERFLAERQPGWFELDALVGPDGRRLGSAPRAGDALRLAHLHRSVAADLAYARRRFPGDPVVEMLERLVARSRPNVYQHRSAGLGQIRHFVTRGYWRRVAEKPGLILLAWFLMLGPALAVGLWTWHDPVNAARLLPAALRTPGAAGEGSLDLPAQVAATSFVGIATNNIRVTMLAFAGGVLAGFGTAWSLVYNGVIIGGVVGLAIDAGRGPRAFELILPHGVLELSCIAVCGAAGFRLGAAVIDPGRRRRIDALVEEGRPAMVMVAGTALWLIVAGLVEGFVTPEAIGLTPALAVGFGLGAVYWMLVATLGRPLRDEA